MLKNGYGKLGQKSSKFLAAVSEMWPVFAKLAKKMASWQRWAKELCLYTIGSELRVVAEAVSRLTAELGINVNKPKLT